MSSTTTIPDVSRVDPGVALVGRTIDKYRVVRLIGRGGMGRVYEAVNTSIRKRVAMKVIDHELSKNEEANARFQREALAASAVESPYIVQIFDAGKTDDGVPYIVMELLRGRDLGSALKGQGKLPLDQTLVVAAQILKGLHHAHGAGIVHRDLKPDNVFMIEREDEPLSVKLLDFGVSKIARQTDSPLKTLTRQGTVVGTPYYMSPEQAQAFPDVDGRTDIYSVGAIIYECLAGRPPVEGQSYEQVIVNICVHEVPDVRTFSPDVPPGIAALIHKALSREREKRFGSAREMLDAIAESAPESLKGSIPSAQLRISAKPSLPSPHAVTTPLDVNELADTVNLADGLKQSGISTKSSVIKVAAKSFPEETLAPTPTTRRRWTVAVAPGVAILLAMALYLRFGGQQSQPDDQANAVPTPVVDGPTVAPSQPSIPVAAPVPTASPTASAQPSSLPSAQPKVRPPVRPPVPAAPKPVSKEDKPSPPPSSEGLELLPR